MTNFKKLKAKNLVTTDGPLFEQFDASDEFIDNSSTRPSCSSSSSWLEAVKPTRPRPPSCFEAVESTRGSQVDSTRKLIASTLHWNASFYVSNSSSMMKRNHSNESNVLYETQGSLKVTWIWRQLSEVEKMSRIYKVTEGLSYLHLNSYGMILCFNPGAYGSFILP